MNEEELTACLGRRMDVIYYSQMAESCRRLADASITARRTGRQALLALAEALEAQAIKSKGN